MLPRLCLLLTTCLLLAAGVRAAGPPAPAHLEFIENRGQWAAAVRYAAGVPGGQLYAEAAGLTYVLTEAFDLHPPGHRAARMTSAAGARLRGQAVQLRFAGATPTGLEPLHRTAEVRNYLRGANPHRWATGVGSFRQLRYRQLWPGIDAHLYENAAQQLEYDFEVAAGADADRIRLRYAGADALRLRPDGSLELLTAVGTITELAPQAWQTDASGQRQLVPCRYVLEGTDVRFQLGRYDHRRPLVIDPTVVFSTYTGARRDNWGFTATYDRQGNLYSGGIVFGVGFPASPGAFSLHPTDSLDIAIIKYDTRATGAAARVWATYLGGSRGDFPESMVVNGQGELLVLGTTASADYPTTAGAYDRSFNLGRDVDPYGYGPLYELPGGTDLVVTRLRADGAALVGSTYLGGAGNDGTLDPHGADSLLVRNYGDPFRGDILVDAADNVYLASNSSSADFPVPGGFQPQAGGGTEAVVCKLTPTLSELVWSTFLGGGGSDAAYSLQRAADGAVFVCGGTASADFPTRGAPLHATARGGVDGFLARISADGQRLERATYLGTDAYDQAYFVQLDTQGQPYVLGQSLGAYPVSSGRYANADSHQFIHQLSADLTQSTFSTVFGSGRPTIDLSPTAFLVDQCNRIFVSGWGGSTNASYGNGTVLNMPLTAAAVQRTTDGADFYLMQLAEGATHLEYATYFGGNGGDHVDGGTSRFDRRGLVYQAVCGGCGGSSSFPMPPGAGYYSTTNNSDYCNNAAFKFDFEPQRAVAGPSQSVCRGAGPQPLHGTPAGGVWTGTGVTGSASTGYTFDASNLPLGTVTLTYTVSTGQCQSQSTLQITVTPTPTISFPPLPYSSLCSSSAPVPLTGQPAGGVFTGPGVVSGNFIPQLAGVGTHTITYTYALGGCTLTATQQVSVLTANAGPSISLCTPLAMPLPLTGTSPGGVWSGLYVIGDAASGYFFAPPGSVSGTVTLSYTVTAASGCTITSTRQVTLLPTPVVTPPAQTQYCVSSSTPVALPSTATWSGPGVRTTGSTSTFTPALAGVGQHVLTYVATFGQCRSQNTITMQVSALPTITLPADTTLCPGATQAFDLRGRPLGGTWSGPNVTPAGVFTPPAGFNGTANLTYTVDNNGCVAAATRRVTALTLPDFQPRWTPITCAADRTAPLRVRFGGTVAVPGATWHFGDGATANGQTTEHVYTATGRYEPRVVIRYGGNAQCEQTYQLPPVDVVAPRDIPNVITPNNDQQNDQFWVTDGCAPRLQVFSRWGNKVYESAAYANDWNGGTQPAGIYYYLVQFQDGRTAKGWLEIVR